MNLKEFDDKCVRITTVWGEVFEGAVSWHDRDYVMHEYGHDLEALHLVPILFYQDDTASIVSLEDVDGPFGHFSGKYGLLERMYLQWGTDMIGEVLDMGDDIRILRQYAALVPLNRGGQEWN